MNDSGFEDEDVVQSAVEKETQEGKYLLSRFREKLQEFEDEYGMDTETFIEKFRSGECGDREDYFEWNTIYESVKHWEQKIQQLEKAG